MKEHSTRSETVHHDGEIRLNTYTKAFFREIYEVASKLDAGEVGGPVRLPNGWSVFKILDRKKELAPYDADARRRSEAYVKIDRARRGCLLASGAARALPRNRPRGEVRARGARRRVVAGGWLSGTPVSCSPLEGRSGSVRPFRIPAIRRLRPPPCPRPPGLGLTAEQLHQRKPVEQGALEAGTLAARHHARISGDRSSLVAKRFGESEGMDQHLPRASAQGGGDVTGQQRR